MARVARGSGAVLLLVVASCGGEVDGQRPDGSGSGGGSAAQGGSGGYAATLDEQWDASVNGVPATHEQLCAMAGTPLPSPCTQAELSYRLSRRWWQCSGQFVFNTDDSIGVEFGTDGRWYLLVADASGGVMRGSGSSYEGTWDMSQTPSNGSCSIQVNIHKGGMLGSFPIFSKHPISVNLNTGGDGGAPTYVAIP